MTGVSTCRPPAGSRVESADRHVRDCRGWVDAVVYLLYSYRSDRRSGFGVRVSISNHYAAKGAGGALCVRCVRAAHTLAEPLAGGIIENLIEGDN